MRDKGTLEQLFPVGERPYVLLANRISRRGFLSWVGRTTIAVSGVGALTTIKSQEAAAAVCCNTNSPKRCALSTGGTINCQYYGSSCTNLCTAGLPSTAYCYECNHTCSTPGGYWYTCGPYGPAAGKFQDCCGSSCSCNEQGCNNKPTCCNYGYGCGCSTNCGDGNCCCLSGTNKCVIGTSTECVTCGTC